MYAIKGKKSAGKFQTSFWLGQFQCWKKHSLGGSESSAVSHWICRSSRLHFQYFRNWYLFQKTWFETFFDITCWVEPDLGKRRPPGRNEWLSAQQLGGKFGVGWNVPSEYIRGYKVLLAFGLRVLLLPWRLKIVKMLSFVLWGTCTSTQCKSNVTFLTKNTTFLWVLNNVLTNSTINTSYVYVFLFRTCLTTFYF